MMEHINSTAEGLALYLAWEAAASLRADAEIPPVAIELRDGRGSRGLRVAESDELPGLFLPERAKGLDELRGFFRGILSKSEPVRAIEDAADSLDALLGSRGAAQDEAARLKSVILRAMEEYLDLILERPPAASGRACAS